MEEQAKKSKKTGGFQALDLSTPVYKAVMKMGYNVPTPIQRKTIPHILQGKDVVAMARTGSGKTAAFCIPTINRLQKHSEMVGARAVLLAPTRELALQTAKVCKQFSRFTDLRLCILVGGKSMENQFERLAANPDIIVATPGRLMHHQVEAELSLQRVEVLVFDEADRLFELGFADQLNMIMKGCSPTRQCLLFSATLPSQLVAFTRAGLNEPEFVRLDVETSLSDQLSLWFLAVRKEEKIAALLFLLRQISTGGKNTVVFVATRHHVEFFQMLLSRSHIASSIVYGSMDQQARTEQINDFRKGKTKVLVVTDVAARGLDIPYLDNVVNFDFPASSKLFVHRTGRTARAGRSGLAISLVTQDEMPYMMDLTVFLGRKVRYEGMEIGEDAKPIVEDPHLPDPHYALLGGMPDVSEEVQDVRRILEKPEMISAYKSMQAAYGLYHKTRVSASRRAAKRSKEFLTQCGGALHLFSLLHPAFKNTAHAHRQEAVDFIESLRAFRPSSEKKGNAISDSSMEQMKTHRLVCTMQMEQEPTFDDMGDVCEKDDKVPGSSGSKRAQPEPEVQRKPKLSKKARKQGKTTIAMLADLELAKMSEVAPVDDDVETSPKSIFDRTRFRDRAFYLSEEVTKDVDPKEEGLAMDHFQFNLMGDDQKSMRSEKQVRRWDVKKKKYVGMRIGADRKQIKEKNEAGKVVRGDKEKSGSYLKWMKDSKLRIQKVGELEETSAMNKIKQDDIAKYSTKTVDFTEEAESPEELKARKAAILAGESGSRSKPIMPRSGNFNEQQLTHKQKRLLKKHLKIGKTSTGQEGGDEVRNARDVAKNRKKSEKRKAKATFTGRKNARAATKKWLDKRLETKKAARAAPTKAKQLIVEKTGKRRR